MSYKQIIAPRKRLVLKRLDPETRTPGGILLPDSAQTKSVFAEVVDSNDYPPGTVVIVNTYAGTTANVGGIEYWLVKAKDVLAVVGRTDTPAMQRTGDECV